MRYVVNVEKPDIGFWVAKCSQLEAIDYIYSPDKDIALGRLIQSIVRHAGTREIDLEVNLPPSEDYNGG